MAELSVFEHIISMTQLHFDNDVGRYLGKLFQIHLHKPAEELTKEELVSLLDWVDESLKYLVEDKQQIEIYMQELNAYADSREPTLP